MNDFDSPFVIQSDPFVDAYLETVEALAVLEIFVQYKQRIPIFKIYTDLQKREQVDEVRRALYLLDVLKDLMVRGLEPEHKNNEYT